MTNRRRYLKNPNTDKFTSLSSTYDQAVADCLMHNGYSCIWTLLALSSVLRRRIVSMYPYINGDNDEFAKLANTTIDPVEGQYHLIGHEPLHIMWTRTGQNIGQIWIPNHFVALFENEQSAGIYMLPKLLLHKFYSM
jgi:hypothetical protein